MYYVYILESGKDNNLYIGYSENLQQRIAKALDVLIDELLKKFFYDSTYR
ncbi:MAG TPA: hypothetical protein ENH86_01425 [Candidatus Jorgensenbacteria bacterium]|nr:hypothetical protein [Candidatus Jorgensenbacteria bacterium]